MIAGDLTTDIQAICGPSLIAVALRGSAPRQTAVPGVSDLDLVVLTDGPLPDLSGLTYALMPALKIDAACGTADQLRHAPDWAWMRFSLAYSGWTVWGTDLIAPLPDPVLGPDAKAHLHGLQHWATGWEGDFDGGDPAERREICQWLMKRIVRALFESLMFALNAYSRDIYPCAKAAAQAYPDVAPAIWEAAHLAVFPTPDRSRIDAVAMQLLPLLRKCASNQSLASHSPGSSSTGRK